MGLGTKLWKTGMDRVYLPFYRSFMIKDQGKDNVTSALDRLARLIGSRQVCSQLWRVTPHCVGSQLLVSLIKSAMPLLGFSSRGHYPSCQLSA